MPATRPIKPPEAPSDKPAEKKLNRYQPEMPQIPGVGDSSPQIRRSSGTNMQPLLQIGGIAAIVAVLGGIIFWWAVSRPRGAAKTAPSPDADSAEQASPAAPPPDAIAPVQQGPTIAASVDELAKPWSAKRFSYTDSLSHEKTPAIVIRIPGGELWAFSLQGPFGRCQLEYVTDLGSLASRFGYRATHPMVVNPCDRTVYDPLKVGALGGNTWARGEIVQGSALRPPISIEVRVSGRSIVADKIE